MKWVSPGHKCDVKTDPSNFIPSFIFFEKIVHDQVSAFIKANHLLYKQQCHQYC